MLEDDEFQAFNLTSALLGAALAASSSAEDRLAEATALVDHAVDLLNAAPALSLRIARLLAFLSRADLTPLGYSKYSDFCAEHVEWGDTWTRSLVRLVDSPLDAVKRAVSLGVVPITAAVEAPGTVEPTEQTIWIDWVRGGGRPERWRTEEPTRHFIEIRGNDARTVHRARSRARLLVGRAVSDDVADTFILRAWRARTPAHELISRALTDPPIPDKPPLLPWPDLPDPATPIVGPWREPRDVHGALAELRAVQRVARTRTVAIGRIVHRLSKEDLYRELGFHSMRGLVSERFPVGIRALERHRRLGDDLAMFPELEAAFEDGMDLGRIVAVARIATEDDIDRWLALARRTSTRELNRAVCMAARAVPSDVLDAYESVIGQIEAAGAWHANDTVALRAAWKPEPEPRRLDVDPDLPEAARWFVETVEIPRQYGVGRIKERDRYTCQNPECLRVGIRIQAHHVIWVSRGGSDDPDNLVAVCKPCHLRLIHAGHVTVERRGDLLLWCYPGRRVWVC